MKVKDITKVDILNGKIWKVLDTDPENITEWIVKETIKVSKNDIIFHSAVVVGSNKIYLTLISKSYEDSGEVGEHLILYNNEWKLFGVDDLEIEESTEGPHLSYISTLDIHEYQKGSFDNRAEHKEKFNYYIKQINNDKIIKFPTKDNILPKIVLNMNNTELLKYLNKISYELKDLSDLRNVSKYNKLATRVFNIIKLLKTQRNAHKELREIIFSDNSYLAGWVSYNLVDIYEKDCLKFIKKRAKENSLDGSGARLWLKNYKEKHR